MKFIVVLVAMLALVACDTPVAGSRDSNVRKLTVGMSSGEVLQILGSSQFQRLVLENPRTYCRSYIYNEVIGAKFVHVTFVDNKLVRARDGFRTAC